MTEFAKYEKFLQLSPDEGDRQIDTLKWERTSPLHDRIERLCQLTQQLAPVCSCVWWVKKEATVICGNVQDKNACAIQESIVSNTTGNQKGNDTAGDNY